MVLMFMVEYLTCFSDPLFLCYVLYILCTPQGKGNIFFNNKTEELINTQKKDGKKFLVIDHIPKKPLINLFSHKS